MSATIVLLTLVAVIAYALLSGRLARSALTLPLVFTAFGFGLIALPGGEAAMAPLDAHKRELAELTLILVLFSDASHVRFGDLRRHWRLAMRMLLIGLPLAVALGTGAAWLIVPGETLAMALLTAAILTPTDAALGLAVVNHPAVPKHLSETINVESGLNDGLVLPFVLLGATQAAAAASHAVDGLFGNAVLQTLIGPLVGAAIGAGVAAAMNRCSALGWTPAPAGGVVFLVTAVLAWIGAEAVGGNGFLATFVAGMVFGNRFEHDMRFVGEFMEGAGQLLLMVTFLVFGAVLLPDALQHLSVSTVALAIAFLSVVRLGAIALSLAGAGLPAREVLFLGWFGPRRLASVLFTLIMIDEYVLPGEHELLACVSMTVSLSIVLHGVTANPLARWIGRARA